MSVAEVRVVPALGVARAENDYTSQRAGADGRAYVAHQLAASYGRHDLVLVAVAPGLGQQMAQALSVFEVGA